MKRREFRARQLSLALFTDAQARSRTQARSSQGLTSGGQLILKRASALLPSGEWNDDHYDVLADGIVVGRIFNARRAGRLALDVDVPLRSRARAETRARLCGDTRRRDGGVREQLAAGITRRVAPPLVIRSPQPVAHCHSELDPGLGKSAFKCRFQQIRHCRSSCACADSGAFLHPRHRTSCTCGAAAKHRRSQMRSHSRRHRGVRRGGW